MTEFWLDFTENFKLQSTFSKPSMRLFLIKFISIQALNKALKLSNLFFENGEISLNLEQFSVTICKKLFFSSKSLKF